jgi:hypothetical protein
MSAPVVEPLESRLLLSRWTYVVGRDFTGSDGHEAIELLGVRRRVYVECDFDDAKTLARLNGCYLVGFDHCRFRNPLGPADPDGQGLQFINCTDCWATHCQFWASPVSSDLFTAYFDAGHTGVVTCSYSEFVGAGVAGFSNALCLDGPGDGRLVADHCDVYGARAGVTVATGQAVIVAVRFVGCPVDVYVARLYRRPASVLTDRPAAVLVGPGGSVGQVLAS